MTSAVRRFGLAVVVISSSLVLDSRVYAANRAPEFAIVSANSYKSSVRTHPLVDVNAYHSDTCGELVSDLQRTPQGKPIIISDDGAKLNGCTDIGHCPAAPTPPPVNNIDSACTKVFAQTIEAAGQHYEHLSSNLSEIIESCSSKDLDWYDLDADDKNALRELVKHASDLDQIAHRGSLSVGVDSQGRGEFRWDGTPVTLMGFSVYGAVVSNQVNYTSYLNALKIGQDPNGTPKGVNLTRIWLTDMWTALGSGCSNPPMVGRGMTPFEEAAGTNLANHFKPDNLSDPFFAKLRDFVSKAWDRGIVVQVTLFERNGLYAGSGGYGRWLGSPYNGANNTFADLSKTAGKQYPYNFASLGCLDTTPPGILAAGWHRELILRTLRELSPYGNVIFEIMNEAEPQTNGDPAWDDLIVPFQGAAATLMDEALVTAPRLAADNFAYVPIGPLHGTFTDDCTATWKAQFATDYVTAGSSFVTNASSSIDEYPRGSIPVDLSDLPFSSTVEIDGEVPYSQSTPDTWFAAALFSANGQPSVAETVFQNGLVWVAVRTTGEWFAFMNGMATILGEGSVNEDPDGEYEIRIRYEPEPTGNRVSAWINNSPVLTEVPVSIPASNIKRVGFDTWSSTGFPPNSVRIRRFEARLDDHSPAGRLVVWSLGLDGRPGNVIVSGSYDGPPTAIRVRWRDLTLNGDWSVSPNSVTAFGNWTLPLDANLSHQILIQAFADDGSAEPTSRTYVHSAP